MANSSVPPPRYSVWQAIGAALNLSMRAIEEVRVIASRPPVKGERGKDGFGFEHMIEEVEDGGRVIVRRFSRGDEIKEFRHVTAVIIYRGVYRADAGGYLRGDLVTYAGSLWHCDAATQEKPGDGSKNWTLAAKRGADGRHGKDGERGPAGPEGKAGRDLTQRGPDGSRW